VGGSPRTERTSGFLGGSWRVVVRRGGQDRRAQGAWFTAGMVIAEAENFSAKR